MGTATEQTQRRILAELESDTLPTDAATETTLASILAECEDIPKHANLDIHPITKHLGVAVEESVLPTDAATQTTLAAALTELQSLLIELKVKADLTETQPVSLATAPTTTVIPGASEKIIGFKDTVADSAENTALSSGANNLDHTAVPAGEVHVITHIYQEYVGTAPDTQRIQASIDGSVRNLDRRAGAVTPDVFVWSGRVVLGPEDFIRHRVTGATLNDDLFGDIVGYKFDAPG